MKKFDIWVNQFDMGTYQGIDEEDALERYARDAGYRNWNEVAEGAEVQMFERTTEE